MAETAKSFNDAKTKVIAKAWKDPSFKQKLLKDPKAALKEMGCHIPENMTVKCVEESKSTLTFVLPAAPSSSERLTEADLSKVAGGGALPGTQPPHCFGP
jgi:hypothetical protein